MKGSFQDNLKVPRRRRTFKLVRGRRPKIQNIPREQESLNHLPRQDTLSINMPLLDALQVPTYSRYFKDILANKYEIGTLGVDNVKMS
jgi:hypothetical protein